MWKILRNFTVALLILAPLTILAAQTPDLVNTYFPVYSLPTDVNYKTYESGIEIKFGITKNYDCVLPTEKAKQDVFATLTFMDDLGKIIMKPANVYPADDKNRAYKNLLIIGVPTNIGPYLVEVPEDIMHNLTQVDMNILCSRPVIGQVYAKMGPFHIGTLTAAIQTTDEAQ